MIAGPRRALLWGLSSGALLVLAFALVLAAAGRLASGDAETVERARQSLVIYGAVVLGKGLLPQLVLTLGLYLGLAPRAGFERSRLAMLGGIALCAAVSALLVAGLLMRQPLPGFPAAVVYRGVGNFLATVAQLTAAVGLACLLPRLLLPALR